MRRSQWMAGAHWLYDTQAGEPHDPGILREPGSRKALFIRAAHGEACFNDVLQDFAGAVDVTLPALQREIQPPPGRSLTGGGSEVCS